MSHEDDHGHGSELSEMTLRVRALETILTEKGYVDPSVLDLIVETFEKKIGPRNGAKVVAKAWSDPEFKRALLADATKAANTLGYTVGDHLVAVENTPTLHNMIVCTLCSCYPTELLGLSPVWYKSALPLGFASRVEDGEGQCIAFRTLCSLWPRALSLTAEAAWMTLTCRH